MFRNLCWIERFQVGFPIKVSGHHKTFARGGGGGEENKISREGFVLLNHHDISNLGEHTNLKGLIKDFFHKINFSILKMFAVIE